MGRKNRNKRDGLLQGENASDKPHRVEPDQEQNPPRTTTGGWLTTPKFGSSTSGGGEIEPGPERD